MVEFDKILKRNLNKEIELTIVHHIEARHLVTSGKLVHYDDDVITLEIQWRNHFWNRYKRKALYICNRKASSILSILEIKT